jgi:glycosyltransferase involved in cell wall biosynthesis
VPDRIIAEGTRWRRARPGGARWWVGRRAGTAVLANGALALAVVWSSLGLLAAGWAWVGLGRDGAVGAESDFGALTGLALPLATASYLLRFLRWHLLAVRVAPGLDLGRSFLVQAVGFGLTVTPARLGEVVKFRLLEQQTAVPVARSIPVILVEKVTEGADRLTARLTPRRAARYVVSSRLQAAELAAVGVDPARTAVVPNAIDGPKLRRWPRRAARRALGLPEHDPIVAYVGHYHHVKGADVLAAAFPAVARAVPRSRLVLAWSGLGEAEPVERALAAAGLGGRVQRLGRVDVAQLLSAADVVALPYRMTIGQAAFPGLVLEAMALGAPLVTTDLPLLRELVEPGRTALVCPPDDPAALARRIVELLVDADLARSMAAAQAAATAGRFDPALLARRWEEIYAEVLAERLAAGRQARVLQPAGGRGGVRRAAVRGPERRPGEPPRAGAGAPAAAPEGERA